MIDRDCIDIISALCKNIHIQGDMEATAEDVVDFAIEVIRKLESCKLSTDEHLRTNDIKTEDRPPWVARYPKGFFDDFGVRNRSMSGVMGMFDPLDIKKGDLTIQWIAKSLSRIPRWCGSSDHIVSVGQHSIMCSYLTPFNFALDALVHDAHEAIFQDIPSPIKKIIGEGLSDVENMIAYGLKKLMGASLSKRIDSVKLADKIAYFIESVKVWDNPLPIFYSFPNPEGAVLCYKERREEILRCMPLSSRKAIEIDDPISERSVKVVASEFVRRYYELGGKDL